jgi:hypothetical protein
MSNTVLSLAEYGKDNIRVFRVVRDGRRHIVVEYNVTVLLQGDIDIRYVIDLLTRIIRQFELTMAPPATTTESYTRADNSVVVATDSSTFVLSFSFFIPEAPPYNAVKNITYCKYLPLSFRGSCHSHTRIYNTQTLQKFRRTFSSLSALRFTSART